MSSDSHSWDVYVSSQRPPQAKIYDWHVLAEGDSWFNLGFNPLNHKFIGGSKNIIEALDFKKQTVIANLALSGDTIQAINDPTNNQKLLTALAYRKWHLILLSAGGNDLIDALTGKYLVNGKQIEVLRKSVKSAHFMDYINTPDLEILLNYIESYYTAFSNLRDSVEDNKNKNTMIIVHCYDYIVARNAPANLPLNKKVGPWAFAAFTDKAYKVPVNFWKLITDYLFNRLAERLRRLENKLPNFAVVNTLGTLHSADPNEKGNSNDWANEIHPNPGGYKKLCRDRISPFIAKYLN